MRTVASGAILVRTIGCILWGLLGCASFPQDVAASMIVVGDSGVTWNGGSSPTMTLGIRNDSNVTEDLLTFQLELEIVAAPSATGQLQFATVAMPADDYLFEGRSMLMPFAFSGPSVTVEDYTDIDLFLGKSVAPGESFELVSLTFDDSLAPAGLFYIVLAAFDDDRASFYSSLSSLDATSFANASNQDGRIVVASVFVGADAPPVPEPQSFPLAIAGAMVCAGWLGRRCRMRRTTSSSRGPTL